MSCTLKLIPTHQRIEMGITGAFMQPPAYDILSPGIPYLDPTSPGTVPPYPIHRQRRQNSREDKLIKLQFDNNCVRYKTHVNFGRAERVALDKAIPNAFKSGASMGQTGFRPRTIREIFPHLYQIYGNPTPVQLKAIKTHMSATHITSFPVETRFHQIESGQRCLPLAAERVLP